MTLAILHPRRYLVAFGALCVAASAPAQGRLAWNEPPAVGSWAELEMTLTQDGKTSTGTYRISCLERARIDGVDHLWCEVVRVKGKKTRVFKLLLPEEDVASADSPLAVAREAIYQDSGKPAMKAAGAQLASLAALLESLQGDSPLRYTSEGREEVALPDGRKVTTFRKAGKAEVTLPGQDPTRVESVIWVAREVPFGVVKRVVTTARGAGAAEVKKVETLTLKSYGGKGATSRVTGAVKPFNPLELLIGS